MNTARERVLGRVRNALGRRDGDPQARSRAEGYLAARAHGPRPTLPTDLVTRFMQRAGDMESTIERVASVGEIPARVARYLDALELPAALAAQKSHAGVCWPEFAKLDWPGAGLSIEARPTIGQDRLGITSVFCGIAETGTMVILPGVETPTATTLLPDTHIAVLRAGRIVPGMEEAFALVIRERSSMPRAVNLISGPSRTGDIEQTIVLGAHGPFRVHILLIEE